MATISQEFTRYFGWLLKHFGYKPYHIVCEYNIYGNYKTFWKKKTPYELMDEHKKRWMSEK